MSAYHVHHGVDTGKEAQQTFYRRGKRAGDWHIDYIFVPTGWRSRIRAVDVGECGEPWNSDHCPVTLELD